MTYKHPMAYYVLIGGSHDGEPWDGEPTPELTLLKRDATASVTALPGFVVPRPTELERYTKRVVHTGQGDIECYGLCTVNDLELQLALFKGYHPKRKPK